MAEKTRAEQYAEMLRDQQPSVLVKASTKGRVIKQADTTSLEKKADLRAALKKLHDFKDGV